MVAVACIKIFVPDTVDGAAPESSAAFVEKVSSAYFERNWSRPRRYGLVAPYSYALADPQVDRLDVKGLQDLARELQQRLFGSDGDGELALLTFEGNETDVTRFAKASRKELPEIMSGQSSSPLTGEVHTVTANQVQSGASAAVVAQCRRAAPVPAPTPEPEAAMGYFGVYNAAKSAFIGNVVLRQAQLKSRSNGERIFEPKSLETIEDFETIAAVARAMPSMPSGFVFLPLSFNALIRPSLHRQYRESLDALPQGRRSNLVAMIYGTPRAPTFQALKTIRELTETRFKHIDLNVADPEFQISEMQLDMVTSVTLRLPLAPEPNRLSALNAFLGHSSAYRGRRILQGVANLYSRKEFEACRGSEPAFLSGGGVAPVQDQPITPQNIAQDALPHDPAFAALTQRPPLAVEL